MAKGKSLCMPCSSAVETFPCISECASIQIELNDCLKAMMSGIIYIIRCCTHECILQRAVQLDIIIFKCKCIQNIYYNVRPRVWRTVACYVQGSDREGVFATTLVWGNIISLLYHMCACMPCSNHVQVDVIVYVLQPCTGTYVSVCMLQPCTGAYVGMLCYICNYVPVHIYVFMLQAIVYQCVWLCAGCNLEPVHIIACFLDMAKEKS